MNLGVYRLNFYVDNFNFRFNEDYQEVGVDREEKWVKVRVLIQFNILRKRSY